MRGEGDCQLFALGGDGFEHLFDFGGDFAQFFDEVERLGWGDGALDLRQMQGKEEERRDLGTKGFSRSDANFRAGVGVDGAIGVASDHGSDDVADGYGFGAEGDHLALRGEGVGGFAGIA